MKNLLRAAPLALALVLCASAAQPSLAQSDSFASFSDQVSAPCRHWAVITPSDTVDLTAIPKAIYVGTGGDVRMIGVGAPVGAAGVTWKGVPAAGLLPTRPRRILATGTTATDLVGCY
jgi:hypothetical protein